MRFVPVKRIAQVIAGQSPPSSDVGDFEGEGLPFLQGNAEFTTLSPTPKYRCDTATRTAERSDILISIRAPVGALNIADTAYGIGRGLVALRPDDSKVHRRFFWWAIHDVVPVLRSVAVGSTYDAVTGEDVGGMTTALPPLDQQAAIADFLDAETARIDAIADAKRRQIVLLETRWQTATRLRLTASGREQPLRRRWAVIDCKHRTPNYIDEGYPVVSPGDVTPGRLDLGRCHRFVDEADLLDLTAGYRQPRRGDIIYSRNASIGIAALVDTDERFTMGQDVCIIRSDDQDPVFLMYTLNTIGIDQLAEMKIGSTFDRVNISQLLDLQIPGFDPSDQRAFALRIDHERRVIDVARDALTRQIALLRERKQALITAAVTGQLDIPGVAA